MKQRTFPLWARVIVGVVVGITLGVAFGRNPWLGPVGNADLGALGMLVIRALKALATPLILVAILDAFLKTRISASSGVRLAAVCAINVSVAMTIGLTLLALANPHGTWVEQIGSLASSVNAGAAPKPLDATLSPLANLAGFIPESLVDPFSRNLVISVVLVSLLFGAALRSVRDAATGEVAAGMQTLEGLVAAAYAVCTKAILWVAELMPFAVAGIVADVVGKNGISVFVVLWPFFRIVFLGLTLHALVWYPLFAWVIGRVPPRRLFREGLDAIVTAVSCNSSLATMPVTLRCLNQMGVREAPARLSAAVGTNFNNDGIMLYEAMATLFLCEAMGMDMSFSEQLTVVFASIGAGVGIAGIPEAGLIILPLVLAAAGMPEASIAVAVPLIVPVDWVLARVRSGVNVLADMTVAIVLDRFEPR